MFQPLSAPRFIVVSGLLTLMCAAGHAAERTGLDAITVPEGFTVELAAASPLVERPMLASFDDRGRLYVCDSAGVNLRGPELAKNPPHAIRMLEDTDGDGRFDRTTLYADKMMFPQGIVWHDGSVYCSSPPSFWKLTDTDGDGVADKREELATGFANTGVADDMHGGSLGPDGRLYWCAGRFPHAICRPGGPLVHQGTAPLIVRARPDGSELEVVCGSQGNAVGVAFSDAGDMFASGTFLAPNSMGAGLRDALIHAVDGGEYPVRDRVLKEHKRTGDLLPPLTHLGVSAASDLLLIRSEAWGDDFGGNLLSAQFNLHKILRHRLEPAGATFGCRNEDFLVSTDTDFHPTDVLEDADGSVLVLDTGAWFRIGCPTSQIAKPEVMGAIYRVRKTAAKKVADPRGLGIAWDKLSPDALAKLLADSRFEVRDHAMARLATLGDPSVGVLKDLLSTSNEVPAKCAAVWTLARIDGSPARAAVRLALDDAASDVRQAAARATGLHRDAEALPILVNLVISDTPRVRREAATALGRIGRRETVPALLAALAEPTDRFLEHALVFALITISDRDATISGFTSSSGPTQRGALVALDQMDTGQLTPEMVAPLLTSTDPATVQTALWVIRQHGEWGAAMVDYFRQWLSRGDVGASERDELKRQLAAFAGNEAVQQLIGETLANDRTAVDTRVLLLEVIGESQLTKVPRAWSAPLVAALADLHAPVVRQAVAAVRALPLDKRPILSRVDAQVNFPDVARRFAGTNLSENFCARWTGVIRAPKSGKYTFWTASDDGSELFIDGRRVVDNSGSHAMRERQGQIELTAGEHELRLDFVQGEGEAGCKLSWSFDGQAKQIVPAEALAHRARGARRDASATMPGLAVEYFALGGRLESFPDLAAGEFDPALVTLVMDAARPTDVRAQAAATVAGRLATIEPAMFERLVSWVKDEQPPLARLDAAEALGKSHLDTAQLLQLAKTVAAGGVLEVPRLLGAFEQTHDPAVGEALVAALGQSAGLKGVGSEALTTTLAGYPESVRAAAEPLLAARRQDVARQRSRLDELSELLVGGEIQRGRELFFGNKKAICATCHTVQGQGGQLGPDLSKIGAIRAPRDLLEAVVFPSASFARGYEPFNVVTHDGQVVSGIIARETADAIHVVNTARVETRIARDDIETLSQSTVSIMPEGMDHQLTRAELADLLAFLRSLR